jgi:hypothetical protein
MNGDSYRGMIPHPKPRKQPVKELSLIITTTTDSGRHGSSRDHGVRTSQHRKYLKLTTSSLPATIDEEIGAIVNDAGRDPPVIEARVHLAAKEM